MPKPPKEVTAYLARATGASRFSAEKAATAVKALLPMLEDAAGEAAELERSLQEAELAEPGTQYEEAFQKIGAIRRITSEMFGQARTLVQAFRELEAVNARYKAASTSE